MPPSNDVDIYAHDLGYIAILEGDDKVLGYNVTVGGGMGMTHGTRKPSRVSPTCWASARPTRP